MAEEVSSYVRLMNRLSGRGGTPSAPSTTSVQNPAMQLSDFFSGLGQTAPPAPTRSYTVVGSSQPHETPAESQARRDRLANSAVGGASNSAGATMAGLLNGIPDRPPPVDFSAPSPFMQSRVYPQVRSVGEAGQNIGALGMMGLSGIGDLATYPFRERGGVFPTASYWWNYSPQHNGPPPASATPAAPPTAQPARPAQQNSQMPQADVSRNTAPIARTQEEIADIQARGGVNNPDGSISWMGPMVSQSGGTFRWNGSPGQQASPAASPADASPAAASDRAVRVLAGQESPPISRGADVRNFVMEILAGDTNLRRPGTMEVDQSNPYLGEAYNRLLGQLTGYYNTNVGGMGQQQQQALNTVQTLGAQGLPGNMANQGQASQANMINAMANQMNANTQRQGLGEANFRSYIENAVASRVPFSQAISEWDARRSGQPVQQTPQQQFQNQITESLNSFGATRTPENRMQVLNSYLTPRLGSDNVNAQELQAMHNTLLAIPEIGRDLINRWLADTRNRQMAHRYMRAVPSLQSTPDYSRPSTLFGSSGEANRYPQVR